MLFWGVVAVTLVVTYIFWVRPVLARTPRFGALYAQEGKMFTAVRLKFAGLKQRLTSIAISVVCFIVMLHDQFWPMLVSSGVDVTKYASFIPDKAWPAIMIAVTLILWYFRKLADERAPQ